MMTSQVNAYKNDGELPVDVAARLPATVNYDVRLGQGLQFTEADLQANRAGHLTPVQTSLLLAAVKRDYGRLLLFFLGIGGLWTVAAFVLPASFIVTLCASVFGFVFFSFVLLLLLDRRGKEIQSVVYPNIEHAEGRVRTMRWRYWNSIWANVRIGWTFYDVPAGGPSAFNDGMWYRLYYLRGSKRVLSAEPIAAAHP